MEMLSQAVSNGASVEVLTKLMDLRDRWEAGEARKAFDAAVSSAKSDIPVIEKNATGHNNRRYADFAQIARTIDPILAGYGLSYRFRAEQDEKLIRVTCVLSHKQGHSEEATLAGPSDTSGSKNAIQAIGSTLTYLQRYSLCQMLGLASSEDDDAGATGGGEVISDEQRDEIQALIDETQSDIRRFCAAFNAPSLADLPVKSFERAKQLLNQKKGQKQ